MVARPAEAGADVKVLEPGACNDLADRAHRNLVLHEAPVNGQGISIQLIAGIHQSPELVDDADRKAQCRMPQPTSGRPRSTRMTSAQTTKPTIAAMQTTVRARPMIHPVRMARCQVLSGGRNRGGRNRGGQNRGNQNGALSSWRASSARDNVTASAYSRSPHRRPTANRHADTKGFKRWTR